MRRRTFLVLLLPSIAGAQSTTDTRLLSQPAVSATHVAFAYAGDLWSSKLDGTGVVRLTTADGDESGPTFSPDGSLIAFTGNYDGNSDVYVVPVGGGTPRRLTWHPGVDATQGFSPDGKTVLFASTRHATPTRNVQLFAVSIDGGAETQLPIPTAAQATYSPDGARIAYNPLPRAFDQWKRYRGGRNSEIWLYTRANHAVEEIPQPASRSNDVDAMWIGNTVYFRSDREGEFNLFAYDVASKRVRALTKFADFPVLAASAGGGKIVYERGGYLYLFNPANSESRKLTIGVAADLRETRPRWVSGAQYIRNAGISPTGARVAFELRGEIVTVPAEKGDARNLTNTAGVNERSPAWSPNGESVAYFSDEGGEYQLHIAPQSGKGAVKKIKPTGNGFYSEPRWSPDGKNISYIDNSQSVFVLNVETGTSKRVGGNKFYGPAQVISTHWSPDSKYLAYTAGVHALESALFAYNVADAKSTRLTYGLASVASPAFDKSGKYLFLLASTDAGPALDWFAQSTTNLPSTTGIYAIVLRKDLPNPFARESDEERGPAAGGRGGAGGGGRGGEGAAGAGAGGRGGEGAAAAPAPGAAAPVAAGTTTIDFDGIDQRIIALPIAPANIANLETGDAGMIYYTRTSDGVTALRRYNLTTRTDQPFVPNAPGYQLSADGKKILYSTGGAFFVANTATPPTPAQGRLAIAEVEVRIDPRAEWTQVFDEAWRINRDYFYAPNMHGTDWAAAKKKYSPFLADAVTKADVNRVIQWMMSELAVGHHRGGGGDRLTAARNVPGGLLGADFDVANGRYRFARIFGGLNWNAQLRAPLTEPGVNVKQGEYLLAVRGIDVRTTASVYSYFENTSGKIVEITVGPNADGTGSRTVEVVPIANEGALRNRAWVEDNVRKVDSLSGGKVAYVYVPNTAQPGYDYFKRYFYPQTHKSAVIVDERDNGGGQIADYYIDILRRPLISYWATRYGEDLATPAASIQGPKTLIANEMAGSGGDLFPWMWRKFNLGPIVGKRTWGGLVGTLGFPGLMDGGNITAPNLAFWTPDEGFGVENVGVPPDVEVDQRPVDVVAGRDPQLERAIAITLEALAKSPVTTPARPAYPKR
ncbi:MAG TPA: PDZ domain-containing protein [Gemmatimonadaceae bacterium]|nr:PDZ domain-containing protein [Gemmatimonadaceae bacterium]